MVKAKKADVDFLPEVAEPIEPKSYSDEETAVQLVKLYFEEVARLGFKRKMDLDAIINAYMYALKRLKRKDEELDALEELVEKEEQELKGVESEDDLFPKI